MLPATEMVFSSGSFDMFLIEVRMTSPQTPIKALVPNRRALTIRRHWPIEALAFNIGRPELHLCIDERPSLTTFCTELACDQRPRFTTRATVAL